MILYFNKAHKLVTREVSNASEAVSMIEQDYSDHNFLYARRDRLSVDRISLEDLRDEAVNRHLKLLSLTIVAIVVILTGVLYLVAHQHG